MIWFLPRGRVFVDVLRPNEADALVEIHSQAFPHPWSADDFAALVADQAVFALAARHDSIFGTRRLVGFVLIRAAADEAEILTIAVRSSHRGRGIGRRLMEDAMRRLYAARIKSLFLEVDRANVPAVKLYRALGFEVVGQRKGYYRRAEGPDAPALVMRAQLR